MTRRARRPTRLAMFVIVALLGASIWSATDAAPALSTSLVANVTDTHATSPTPFGAKIGATGSGDTELHEA